MPVRRTGRGDPGASLPRIRSGIISWPAGSARPPRRNPQTYPAGMREKRRSRRQRPTSRAAHAQKRSPTPSGLKAPGQFIGRKRGGTVGPTPHCRDRSAGPCPSPTKGHANAEPLSTGRTTAPAALICRNFSSWLRLGSCFGCRLGCRLGGVCAAGAAPRICWRLVRNIS